MEDILNSSEFNLIDEPWICVRRSNCTIEQINLKQLFSDAHNCIELAGESKTQDFAVLRFLLAIIYTTFSRYDIDGNDAEAEDEDYFIDLWADIWNRKSFPQNPVNKYLENWHDRFWLFDEKKPFYQSYETENKGMQDVSKMIGTMFQSGNKKRIFADRINDGIKLSYAEAARWLLHLICFDDIAAKKPTPKRAYSGQLGLIAVKGNNLFETIMLNFVSLLMFDNDKIVEQHPLWEKETISEGFNNVIAVPNNQAELLTLQSRKVLLEKTDNMVTGYYLSGGDYFEEEDVFSEQMTIWKGETDKQNSSVTFKPKRHSSSAKAWQEFGAIAAFSDTSGQDSTANRERTPGVISWVNYLISKKILEAKFINVSTAAVIYDFGQATSLPVKDLISDSLTFHSKLLTEDYKIFRNTINKEIEKIEKIADYTKYLSINLQKASGASGDKISGDNAKMQFYSKIDRPFRLWLKDISGVESAIDIKKAFDEKLFSIAVKFGEELASELGDEAIFGRYIKPNSSDKKEKHQICSSAEALNFYYSEIRKLLDIKVGDNNE